MKTVISALAIVVLLSAIAPNVIGSQGYWTPYDTHIPQGMTAYHIFLDGTYPSYVDRSYKLVNENLTACLDFGSDVYPNPRKPLVCHPIKESDIPSTNDSIMDVGYFVGSNKLNESAAGVCVRVGYHNWYSCNSQTIDAHSWYHSSPKLLYDMSGQIYDDVFANDACITADQYFETFMNFFYSQEYNRYA